MYLYDVFSLSPSQLESLYSSQNVFLPLDISNSLTVFIQSQNISVVRTFIQIHDFAISGMFD